MYRRTQHTLEHYIEFGWYQIYHALVIQMIICLEVVNMSMMGYAGVEPTISCDFETLNGTLSRVNSSNGNKEEICGLIKNGTCGNYTETSDFYSIVMEWGLICDRIHLKYLTMSIQMVGVLIGAPSAGQISDLFGRKLTLVSCITGMIFVSGSSILSRSWLAFTIFRFFIGLFVGGTITTMFVFLVEFLKQRHRLWVTSVITWPWGIMYMALAGWLTQDWRALSLYVNCLGFLIYPFLWFTKESPRWLIQRGQAQEAAEVLTSLARWNRQAIDEEELHNMIEKEMTVIRRQKFSFWHLCYTGSLSKHTLVLALAWFTVSLYGYFVVFNMGEFVGSMFLNTTIYGFSRLMLMFVVLFLDITFRWFGRKTIHTIMELFMFLGAVTVTVFELIDFPEKDIGLRWISLASAVATGPVWMVVYLLSAELYPTPVRNLANSFCSACARVGGVAAPQVLYLGQFWKPAPFILFACLMFLDLVLFLLVLPETKGKPLPEHMPNPSERLKCCGGSEDSELGYPYSPVKKQPKYKERGRSGTQRSESFAVYRFNSVSQEQL